MAGVTELRVTLTVEDFDQALAFYRDALGLEQVADWSSESGRVVALDAGRATLELFDRAQAESVDAIEAGRPGAGTGPVPVTGRSRRGHAPAAGRGRPPPGRAAGHDAGGRPQRPGPGAGRDAADAVPGRVAAARCHRLSPPVPGHEEERHRRHAGQPPFPGGAGA